MASERARRAARDLFPDSNEASIAMYAGVIDLAADLPALEAQAARVEELERESIRRGDRLAEVTFKRVDLRNERDALAKRIANAIDHFEREGYIGLEALPKWIEDGVRILRGEAEK